MTQRLYTIKEVSMRTELSTQLIRKWEERYEAVLPERMANGYRGYTLADIDTLLWLKKQVDEGVPIGMAVMEWKSGRQNTEAEAVQHNEADLSSNENMLPDSNHANLVQMNEPIQQLLHFFIQLDHSSAQRFYEQLFAIHNLEHLLLHILEPTMVELGNQWERGEISEYQEHFGSHFIRDKTLSILSLFRPNVDRPLFVTACGPGERHELGILFFGFFALQEGFRLAHLGIMPSEKGIFDCLEDVHPVAFTFSFSLTRHLEEANDFLLELDRRIKAGNWPTHVFIGGRAVWEDALLPGTERVFLVSGDAESSVKKIKSRLRIH